MQNFDWTLLLLTAVAAGIGIMNLYSASGSLVTDGQTPYYMKQLYWFCIGVVILALAVVLDYHILETAAYPLYVFSLFLLLMVIVFGQEISGSRRWLRIMSFSIQPSEIVKLTLIFALARYFQDHDLLEGYTLRIDSLIQRACWDVRLKASIPIDSTGITPERDSTVEGGSNERCSSERDSIVD